jgi:putative membrane protein
MNEEPTHKQSMAPLDSSTRLAYERTYLAHERTLMGGCERLYRSSRLGSPSRSFLSTCVRKRARAPLLGPRAVGIIMIATGLVALALATMQHRRASKVLHERCPDLHPSLAGVMAAFFALLGILALFSAILRQ